MQVTDLYEPIKRETCQGLEDLCKVVLETESNPERLARTLPYTTESRRVPYQKRKTGIGLVSNWYVNGRKDE